MDRFITNGVKNHHKNKQVKHDPSTEFEPTTIDAIKEQVITARSWQSSARAQSQKASARVRPGSSKRLNVVKPLISVEAAVGMSRKVVTPDITVGMLL